MLKYSLDTVKEILTWAYHMESILLQMVTVLNCLAEVQIRFSMFMTYVI